MRKNTTSHSCWKCLQRGLTLNGPRQPALATPWSTSRSSLAKASRQHREYATAATLDNGPNSSENAWKERPIRERLQHWLDTEGSNFKKEPLTDLSAIGRNQNNMTRPESPRSMSVLETTSSTQESVAFDSDELVDLRALSMPVEAGDLIEFRSETFRNTILAVCLGKFNGLEHFYTSTGKWYTSEGAQSLFKIHGFASLSEMQPIIECLPAGGLSAEEINTLQLLKENNPSRMAGAKLLQKMKDFMEETEMVFRTNTGVLDMPWRNVMSHLFPDKEARARKAHKPQYLSLYDLAEILLPGYNATGEDVRLTNNSAKLYATHRALIADDMGFRPILHLTGRQSYLYEVTPSNTYNTVTYLRAIMRAQSNWTDQAVMQGKTPTDTPARGVAQIEGFVARCQKAIDASRRRRQWSPHGLLGVDSKVQEEARVEINWQESDRPYLEFLFLWAAEDRIARGSPLIAVGGWLLRAIDRYQDVTYLDGSVAWTCLQELQLVAPWDIQARFRLGLPDIIVSRHAGVNFQGVPLQDLPPSLHDSSRRGYLENQDGVGHLRKDWGELAAFCIDSASTTDIDDAISLERTGKDDEFLIHIHVADPGSSISMQSRFAKRAAQWPQTRYLPGHFERMILEATVREVFSLAKGSRCLTFTAKVNLAGEVLESNITPGKLQNVVYMEPNAVQEVIGTEPKILDSSRKTFSVGVLPVDSDSFHRGLENITTDGTTPAAIEQPTPRKMTTASELDPSQHSDLQTLSTLAKALHKKRLDAGAMPLYWPRPSASVSFASASANISGITMHTTGDPCIQIKYSGTADPLVESLMRLAGEVAAKWCADRNIPAPYRTQPYAAANADAIEKYTRDVMYPQLLAGKRPSERQTRTLRSLVGVDQITARPGPHITMGAEAYVKATSPLRRYPDLLVHWQIEAALIEEARRGESLVGVVHDVSSDPAESHPFLPYSRVQLERDVLPMLRVRERLMKKLDNQDGNKQYILQALVRAWKFGDVSPGTEPLPETFKMTVLDVLGRRALRGRLDWFDLNVLMEKADLIPSGVLMADVCVDDVIEVELVDVNVHSGRVFVRAVGKVPSPEKVVEEALSEVE